MMRTSVYITVILCWLVAVTPEAKAATTNSGGRAQCDPVCCFWIGNQVFYECHTDRFNCVVWCDIAVRCLGGFVEGDVTVDEGQISYFQTNKGSYPVIDCKPAVVTGATSDQCSVFEDGCQSWSVPVYLGCNGMYYDVTCKYGTGTMQIISQTQQIARDY